ncbi:myosin light chain kinase 2, skeletal/cardiac muscle isoform X1 [Alosa sapidissima]|uniref:myosin light chain kinase 2, skeletal/cardiac muscle isoform X1 n=1 Tax=Alosa sapidissima TaxID=34773 RepID=UPI001C09683F|nr:myosin light chain kinase 2, skeletal/cardiac muscle isoform X1 [Alosa sapidissima]
MDKKQSATPTYPWRNVSTGATGPGQCPATRPAILANLKARLDNFEAKPTVPLPQPSRDCIMCRTCSKHTNQQEAMTSMLSTQARVLDSLQKNVLDIQRTLETLMRGLEERGLHTIAENVSVPMGIQQRRKSLPMRMLADEVYVQLEANRHEQRVLTGLYRNVDSNSLTDTSGHKETEAAAVPRTKQERGHQSPDQSDVKSISVKQNVPATSSSVKANTVSKNAMSEGKVIKVTPASKTVVASVSPPVGCPGSKEQNTSDSQSGYEPKPGLPPMALSPQPQTGSVGDGPGTASAKNELGQSRLQNSKPAPEPASKCTPPLVKTTDPCTEEPAAAPPDKDSSMDKQIQSSPAQPTVSVKSPPTKFPKEAENAAASPLSLAPSKKTQLAVPSFMADVLSLRHVQSCPESLQRLQSLQPNTDPVPDKLPLLPKTPATAPVLAPADKVPASDIQIRVVPAVDEKTTTTKDPPKTALKVVDDVAPQPAPFSHRFVALNSSPPYDLFTVHTKEVLGGGRFGKVHKCTEITTGLRLAAKIISTRTAKEKELTMNEIQVMNQLNHANILQLYAAFEVKNQAILIIEYVEGGELFERIVDESSPLTEVDAMVFVKQICEGVQYMHQMYVLHLDLKPENILCVNHTGHQVKIIDFGLARRYKPREKLRVSFGTPEFLAPEIVNFDFVSFPTDMWSLGVITYMLLSGLSPFLGDDDTQTLNNVVMVNWYFDEDAFEHISAEAKDFISNLLIKEKSGRFSAAQCLKHPWLNNISEKAKYSNIVLKSQVSLKKYMARRMWKKNYIAVVAANRFKKIASSGSLTSLGI